MRDIKFRAFDKQKSRMFEVYGIGKDFVTENTLDGVDEGTNCFSGKDFRERIEIMQFTGLKDKNGIDIYDLDIVKLSFKEYYSNECVTVDEESIVIGKITFENGGYFVNEKDSTWLYLNDIIEYAEIEIIGNIHINPELLK